MSVAIVNPWTGVVEHRYEYDSAAVVETRLADSAAAFGAWSKLGTDMRAEHLRRIAVELRAARERIATTMSAEMGKLRREALAEIDKSALACEHYAEHAAANLQDEPVSTEAARSYVRYEPLGCVLAVMPWNFPLWQVFRFFAPAAMAGNVALLKPASNVPRSSDHIAETLARAGLPHGVFGVLHVDGAATSGVIADRRVHAVTLTGSDAAGRSVASAAGSQLKKCVMELGGSDPFVVLDDADLDLTVAAAIRSRFGNAGQTCIAAKRFIVTPGIADAFVARFASAASALAVGDPNDAATTLAPMAREDLRDALHAQVERSLDAGAVARLGCVRGEGPTHYPASILDHVAPGMPAYDEELFGPVAIVLRVGSEADAIRVANDTAFGLGASVWTRDTARGEAVARSIDAGACFVNAEVRSDVRLPFGGIKASGFGRELGAVGIREFTNVKTVYVGAAG